VRIRAWLDLEFLERFRSGIQVGDVVARLTDKPDLAVRRHIRIARPTRELDAEFLDRYRLIRLSLERQRREQRGSQYNSGAYSHNSLFMARGWMLNLIPPSRGAQVQTLWFPLAGWGWRLPAAARSAGRSPASA
jgi:hypothetical protein